MARKTTAVLRRPLGYIAYERTKTYQDYPGCLPKYKWLVQEALKQADKMFNTFEPYYCKVCGLPTKRSQWQDHVRYHAGQLKLTVPEPVDTRLVSYADLRSIVGDTLGEKDDEIEFRVEFSALVEMLITDLRAISSEHEGNPVFCADCEGEEV